MHRNILIKDRVEFLKICIEIFMGSENLVRNTKSSITVNPLLSDHPLLSASYNKRPLEKKKFNKRLPLISAPSNKRTPYPY